MWPAGTRRASSRNTAAFIPLGAELPAGERPGQHVRPQDRSPLEPVAGAEVHTRQRSGAQARGKATLPGKGMRVKAGTGEPMGAGDVGRRMWAAGRDTEGWGNVTAADGGKGGRIWSRRLGAVGGCGGSRMVMRGLLGRAGTAPPC